MLILFYIVKNISNNNIIIGKQTLRPGCETKVYELESLEKLIKLGYVIINETADNSSLIYKEYKNSIVKVKPNLKNDNLKKDLIESFFKFYLNQELSEKDLNILKYFYKKIGFTSKLKKENLSLLDNVQNQEELVEILLNNIYPELIELFLINQKEN